MSKTIRSAGYRSATHAGYSAQAQHNSVEQVGSLEFTDNTCECRCSAQFIFVGAVRYNVPKCCATRVCCACADLITCVAVMHLTLRTGYEKHGRKNPLPFPIFEAVTCRQSAPDFLIRERQEFKEEGKPRVSLPFCPCGGRRTFLRSAERNSPRWVSAAKKGCRSERHSTNVPRVPQIVSAGKIKGRTMKVRPFSYSASCR